VQVLSVGTSVESKLERVYRYNIQTDISGKSGKLFSTVFFILLLRTQVQSTYMEILSRTAIGL